MPAFPPVRQLLAGRLTIIVQFKMPRGLSNGELMIGLSANPNSAPKARYNDMDVYVSLEMSAVSLKEPWLVRLAQGSRPDPPEPERFELCNGALVISTDFS